MTSRSLAQSRQRIRANLQRGLRIREKHRSSDPPASKTGPTEALGLNASAGPAT